MGTFITALLSISGPLDPFGGANAKASTVVFSALKPATTPLSYLFLSISCEAEASFTRAVGSVARAGVSIDVIIFCDTSRANSLSCRTSFHISTVSTPYFGELTGRFVGVDANSGPVSRNRWSNSASIVDDGDHCTSVSLVSNHGYEPLAAF